MATIQPGTKAARRLKNPTWRAWNSKWVLWSVAGVGLLNGIGWTYIGIKANRLSWKITAAGYWVASFASVFVVPTWRWTFAALLALWVGGSIHALRANRGWLSYRAQDNSTWYDAPTDESVHPSTSTPAIEAPQTNQSAWPDLLPPPVEAPESAQS